MKELTPDLLDGIKYEEQVELKGRNDESYTIKIHPLRTSEVAKIQRIATAAVKIRADQIGKNMAKESLEMEAGEMAEAKYKSWIEATALGTNDKAWTIETVDNHWLPEWVEKVGKRVLEISGVSDEKDGGSVNSFRKK
ncbi:hypothetical protein IC620_15490 [Hazenella sp. IB182357]|uniref:Uncharacterized protein n=1 Tax=Polycladospora coralii TaxID=2771432 RepID=A0A926NHP7_9BACL|nr:hypothetical protein [Polycladospora coralii]MBD1373749.1 hypothetical protein [Polycladospora coralii]